IDRKTIIIKERVYPDKSVELVKNIDVGGSVTDEEGVPLAGATVRVKDTYKMVVADVNGAFSFTNLDEDAVLVVSYTGFITEEVELNGDTPIAVVLRKSVEKLEDIMVIGYGSLSKSDLTGAVGQVN